VDSARGDMYYLTVVGDEIRAIGLVLTPHLLYLLTTEPTRQGWPEYAYHCGLEYRTRNRESLDLDPYQQIGYCAIFFWVLVGPFRKPAK
jgi:hypothetical protein